MFGKRQASWPCLLVVLLAGACTGCSSLCAPLPGGGSDTARPFADVPPPPGCDLVWAYVYESGSYRYGTLIYKGSPDSDEVVEAYKRQMPREDWIYSETLRIGNTVVRYAKKDKQSEHCDIVIGKGNWLGRRYVIVTVTGSRAK